MLNLYPYNGGHLMVVPYRHVADYTDLDDAGDRRARPSFTKRAMTALRTASGAHGFNIGMNQGAVAGAGIAAHLHQHVVPRWGGDTNFMPVVGHTKVLPQLLADTRKMLAEAWPTALSPGAVGLRRPAVRTPRPVRPHRPPVQRRLTRRTRRPSAASASWTDAAEDSERLPKLLGVHAVLVEHPDRRRVHRPAAPGSRRAARRRP